MNNFFKIGFVVAVLFLIPLYTNMYAEAEILRTLKVGDRGADVKELQIFLNTDPATRIANSGVGSPGYESTYFGGLTAAAVKKFQIKYAYETLTPAGLSTPTGVVGSFTRAMIYKLSQVKLSSNTTPIGVSTTTGNAPKVTRVTPTIVRSQQQSITITGTGFTPYGNRVIFSSETEYGVEAASPSGMTIEVPFSFSLAQKMKQQLAAYRGTPQYAELAATLVANLSGETVERINGVPHVRVILIVKNAYGESSPTSFLVDIKSLL